MELLLLAALWGGAFLLLRITSPVFGPIFLIELRVIIGLLVLLPFIIYSGKYNDLYRNWQTIALVTITNMCVPFCLLAYATLSIGAGLASILNATVPFFSALTGWLMFSRPPGKGALAGLGIGFAGVVVLILADGSGVSIGTSLIAVIAGLTASVLYGFSTNLINNRLMGVSGLAITVGNLFFSSIFLMPLALFSFPDQSPPLNAWLSLLILGTFCTGLAYVLFYRLIMKIGPYQAVTVTYLVPVFSICYGMILLGEQFTLFMVVGSIMVLLGVAVTTGRIALPPRASGN